MNKNLNKDLNKNLNKDLNIPKRDIFMDKVGEALSEASMAWSETPKGVFDSDRCCELIHDIVEIHDDIVSGEIKRYQQEEATDGNI